MGLGGLSWSAFGVDISTKTPPVIPTKGRWVAIELYGLAAGELKQIGREREASQSIALHVAGKPLSDASLVYQVASWVITSLEEIASVSEHVYVVGEGNYKMKRHEKARRWCLTLLALVHYYFTRTNLTLLLYLLTPL
jgi:hypothetical protein